MAIDVGNPWEAAPDRRTGIEFEYEVKEYLRTNLSNDYFFCHSVLVTDPPQGYRRRQDRPYGKPRLRELDFVVAGPNGLFLLETKFKQRVQGPFSGNWNYVRMHNGKPVAQSLQPEGAINVMHNRVLQAKGQVQNNLPGQFQPFTEPQAVFVFPNDCEIRLTDSAGRLIMVQNNYHCCRLSDLPAKIARMPLPTFKGHSPVPLTASEARQLVELFERGSVPEPGLVGSYRIVEPGPVEVAPNGITFIAHRIEHTEHGDTRRGKWYSLGALADQDKEKFKAQLHRHAKVQRAIGDHPNIHKHYDDQFDLIGDGYWVIEEWIDGEPLAELLAGPSLHGLDLKSFMAGIARGLHAMHMHKFVFRDLSPRTILVDRKKQRPILTNFELAKALDNSPTVSVAELVRDPYMAPEVVDDTQKLDVRADVYSWGACLFHLATGRVPEANPNLAALRASGLPVPIVKLTEECLSPFFSRRPASMIVVLQALERWPNA